MSSPNRRQASRKARERSKKADRRRKQETRQRDNLLLDSDEAAFRHDWPRVVDRLTRLLTVRPNHPEVHARLAYAYFMLQRPADGLVHFDQLRDIEYDPELRYHAALACWQVGDNARAGTMASQFLRETRGAPEMEVPRSYARVLLGNCRRETRNTRASAARMQPQSRPTDEPAGTVAGTPNQPSLPLSPETAASASPKLIAPLRSTSRQQPSAPPRLAALRSAPPAPSVVPAPPAAQTESAAPTPTASVRPSPPTLPAAQLPEIEVTFSWDDPAVATLLRADAGSLADALLRRDYAELRLQRGFDQLVALPQLRGVEHFWYQIATVRRILRDFRGRALLADEVGLGKTIEAALVLKEYWMRGLVRRAIVLVPPSLVTQWVGELASKFELHPVTPDTDGYSADPDAFWSAHPLIVASLALARQPANRERLAQIDFDMVIVDEAHYVKKRTTASWQLINNLKKRFLLLLSATPVGNDLSELYNLISLLRPGLLSTEARFRREYGQATSLDDPARRERLRTLLSDVMIRNTRAHIDLKLPRRLAATIRVEPDASERQTLNAVDEMIRVRYVAAPPTTRLGLMTLQMQAGSSPAALGRGLAHYIQAGDPAISKLIDLLGAESRGATGADSERGKDGAKVRALVELLGHSAEKAIVFSRYLATIEAIERALAAAGVRVAVYHGQLTSFQKDAAVADFEDEARVLLATDIGGEGRNLQFCRTIVNFDLPWNPVTIEQRVGRVHRIGQTRDVYVFNLYLSGSVEERILQVLHDKINLFELVAGEMEMILGRLDEDQDFAALVMDLWTSGTTPEERERAFAALGERLSVAKTDYLKTQAVDRALFGEDYEA